MDLLHAQAHEFHSSIAAIQANQTSFQNSFSSQLAQFQQMMLEGFNRFTPPHSTPTTTIQTLPSISFGSIPIPSTTWTGLGLSNPPSPLHTHPSTHATMSFSTSSTPLYSTITTSSPIGPRHGTIPSYNSPINQSPRFQNPNHSGYHEFSTYTPPKIDLPRFNGEDVVGWLAMAERYLRTYCVPLHERVQTVASHFGPDASVWMNAYELRNPAPTWETFVPALLEHFGSGSNNDFKATLSHLQHTNFVDEYITAFTKLSCRAPEWTDEQLLPIFCGGLKNDIKHDVLAYDPTTLARAQCLARRFVSKLLDLRQARFQRSAPQTNTHRSFPNTHSRFSQPTYPSSTPFPSPPPSTKYPTHSRILSPTEQRERRAKGLCFNCDEQYSSTHNCKKHVMAILECPQPFEDLSELSECSLTTKDPNTEIEPLCPLYAITHTHMGELIRLKGSIDDIFPLMYSLIADLQ